MFRNQLGIQIPDIHHRKVYVCEGSQSTISVYDTEMVLTIINNHWALVYLADTILSKCTLVLIFFYFSLRIAENLIRLHTIYVRIPLHKCVRVYVFMNANLDMSEKYVFLLRFFNLMERIKCNMSLRKNDSRIL